jgi:hypothetical protein
MSQILNSGTFTITTPSGQSWKGDSTVTVAQSGSNSVAVIQNISISAWSGLDTGSLSDVRYMHFDNVSTGSIKVATDSAGTNVITELAPNDVSVIAYASGSLPTLYAKAFNSASVLQYILAEQ